jgi:XTP/dITP diphosphohydrolase
MRLIIATRNKNKFKEIKEILKGIKMDIISLNELNKKIVIKEDGKTFLENALKKAKVVSGLYKDDYVVGEDSGLEVFSLNRRPGVFSKRFAKKNATDLENNLKLLKELEGKKREERKACFVCCLALVRNKKVIKIFWGRLSGFISKEMKGKSGFGYDPIFYLPKYKKTLAQFSLKMKNRISHRAKAFCRLKEYLLSD